MLQENYSANPPEAIPVAGATVTGSDVYYCGNERSQIIFNSSKTNSTGWASLLFGGFGIYYLDIVLNNQLNNTISVQTVLVSTTCVVYNISTGNVTTSTCSAFSQHCG